MNRLRLDGLPKALVVLLALSELVGKTFLKGLAVAASTGGGSTGVAVGRVGEAPSAVLVVVVAVAIGARVVLIAAVVSVCLLVTVVGGGGAVVGVASCVLTRIGVAVAVRVSRAAVGVVVAVGGCVVTSTTTTTIPD